MLYFRVIACVGIWGTWGDRNCLCVFVFAYIEHAISLRLTQRAVFAKILCPISLLPIVVVTLHLCTRFISMQSVCSYTLKVSVIHLYSFVCLYHITTCGNVFEPGQCVKYVSQILSILSVNKVPFLWQFTYRKLFFMSHLPYV